MRWLLLVLMTIFTCGTAIAQVQLNPGDNIQAAIDANPPGTVFNLSAGIYRNQNLSPQSGDQLNGVAGQTSLNGSVILSPWTRSGSYWVYTGMPAPLLYNTDVPPLPCCPLAQHRNDLFINNQLYTRAASVSAVTSGAWYFDETNLIGYLTDNPTGKTVELSVTPNALTGHSQPAWGGVNVTVQNIIVEKYASDAGDVAIAAGYGWVLYNVTAQWNHGGGAGIGENAAIEQGSYSDNGQIGIFLYNSTNAVVHWAEIARNNYAGYDYNYEAGGLKGGTTSGNPSASGMQIINNYVHENNGVGLQMDTDSSNYTYAGNYIAWNVAEGISDEKNYGPLIHDNVLRGNVQAGSADYAYAAQITLNDTQYAQIYNNVIEVADNVGQGITMLGQARGSSPFATIGVYRLTHNSVYNNTLTYDDNHGRSGMAFWYVTDDGTNTWDYDTYYMPDTSQPHWFFFTNSGSLLNWAAVQSSTPYEQHGQALVTPP